MLLNITLVSIFTQKLKHILSVLCTYWMPTALTAVSKTQTSRILPKKKKICMPVNLPQPSSILSEFLPLQLYFVLTAVHRNTF